MYERDDNLPFLSHVTNMMKVSPATAVNVPSLFLAIDRAVNIRPAVNGQINLAPAYAVQRAPFRIKLAEMFFRSAMQRATHQAVSFLWATSLHTRHVQPHLHAQRPPLFTSVRRFQPRKIFCAAFKSASLPGSIASTSVISCAMSECTL